MAGLVPAIHVDLSKFKYPPTRRTERADLPARGRYGSL